ncbi:MAG: hypothetical protein AABY68_02920 [Pseudomonadota bacterium]
MPSKRYRPPKVLKEWIRDESQGDLCQLIVFDNESVCSAIGSLAHSSGSKSCSWSAFTKGEMHELVISTVGYQALNEAVEFISNQTKAKEKKWWKFWR